jgi:formylglycine-generating enzyme required for sulfatase activity
VPLEGWLREAQDLLDRGRAYARELEELRARSLPVDPDDPRERAARRRAEAHAEDVRHVRDYYRREILRMEQVGGLSSELLTEPEVRARLQSLEQKAVETETLLPERVTWSYADPEDQLRFDALQALVPALAPFVDTPDAEGLVRRMERRLEFARSVEDRSFRDAREAWERAIASIGDVRDSPAYGGASIRPQLGLVPLRRDPESGLWEFLHLQSGAAPAIGPDGRWVLGDETGIVLVLIPGGEFLMGAQSDDPSRPNFDPEAEADESAFFEGGRQAFPAVLEPYFISKYEVTQAQWRRLAGRDPSSSTSALRPDHVHSRLHPVEHVAWKEAREVLLEVGLELPTEARWEFAARSGTATPWWTGRERESLRGAANVADRRSAESWEATARDKADWTALDDGFVLHAPVGSFRPNAYGLFDVCGNVSEWCSDSGFVTYDRYTEVHYGDLERQIWSEGLRVRRGGSFATRAALARSSARAFSGPEDTREDTGVRPARDLD